MPIQKTPLVKVVAPDGQPWATIGDLVKARSTYKFTAKKQTTRQYEFSLLNLVEVALLFRADPKMTPPNRSGKRVTLANYLPILALPLSILTDELVDEFQQARMTHAEREKRDELSCRITTNTELRQARAALTLRAVTACRRAKLNLPDFKAFLEAPVLEKAKRSVVAPHEDVIRNLHNSFRSLRGDRPLFIDGSGGIGQVYPGSSGDAPRNTYFDPVILHNGKFEKTTGYCTDVFFAQALSWIERGKGKEPFFAYIATNVPHEPLQVREEDFARYKDKVNDPKVARFFGMLANADDNIGRLLAKLTEWGLDQNTLIVFMNDNGGTTGTKIYNAGMRGGKVTPWLGGTRACSFWRWPGRIAAQDVDALAAHIDFFPTLAALAGARLDDATASQVEGRSLIPLLENPQAPWAERTLFTHVGRWERFSDPEKAKFAKCAVRTKQWHLVSIRGGSQPAWELYHLPSDPGELRNVATQHTEVVDRLAAEYDRWWAAVRPAFVNENAVGPRLNPYAELYWKQFGGGPDDEDLRIMEPSQRTIPSARSSNSPLNR
jgi:arylsulfatase